MHNIVTYRPSKPVCSAFAGWIKWVCLFFFLCLASTLSYAADPLYINYDMYIAKGSNTQWYGDVELGPNARLYIEDGEKIYFYGTTFRVSPGAKIYGVKNSWTSTSIGEGTGTLVTRQPNPNTNKTSLQVLDGGNSGSKTNNTLTSLEIDNHAGLMLINTNARVGSNITFTNGHLFLEEQDIVLSDIATLTGYDASKYFVTELTGHVVKEDFTTAFIFPVGSAENDYTPATIKPAATNTVHVNVANYSKSLPDENGLVGMDRTWNIFADREGGAEISLQHNSATNMSDYVSASSFITRYGEGRNNTGDYLSSLAWQLNAPVVESKGSETGSELSTRTYYSLALYGNVNESFYTKASTNGPKPNEDDIFVPEGFSPNGDGVNDFFVIKGIEKYPNCHFTVFNRGGNKVFESTKGYKKEWDGKTMFGITVGGRELPTDTYFYILNLKDGGGNYRGYIYLAR